MIAVVPGGLFLGRAERAEAQVLAPTSPALQLLVPLPKPAGPPPVDQVLQSGVLIVVSKASQKMHVFHNGKLWASSPVSTGKRGHSTPAGVFPILQKKTYHRSNLYSNAPMPFMQRLTWGGVAIHAGRLPGYPASHGCIRLPYGFAKSLFALTRAATTTVVVTNEATGSETVAMTLALNAQSGRPAALAAAIPPVAVPSPAPSSPQFAGRGQTIQLAAALSAAEAEARWQSLVSLHPELAGFRKDVVSAVVGSRRYWRLRASAPEAYAMCASLKRSGQDCFNVS
ncbi:L,D-transpeptidase family protein [Novosphingobium sp. SL115]|uniref:L,D-transpeptidase family protein n=1 Tax=Novosphingobium sp. SL115 TaxID=2995150 RepID=UPI0022750E46|nr:L,D-transpeptidase family protein [Novosphingobium sp. SL115]MCY1671588.1 L,D-transpeptidase family protein [Novosphingobium sp. SL115]